MAYDALLPCLAGMGRALVVCDALSGYCPRDPRENVLYGVVSAQLETFLARQRRRERPVPRFVERELRSFLECGVLAHGFLRVHCDNCGEDRVVAFSCKGRGFCSSCGGRRMADTAAHLVDCVLPEVPVRQWVLSLPFALRYRLAYDARLVRDVLHIFVAAVFGSLRRRARDHSGLRQAQCTSIGSRAVGEVPPGRTAYRGLQSPRHRCDSCGSSSLIWGPSR